MLKIMISFDIIAGRTKRAPEWMQKSGLEWCYRIYQEPRRMRKRYATTNPVFVWMVIKEFIKIKFRDLGIEALGNCELTPMK
jgi:N-acetylglucosaminyldiphosphoundecaprenol N-acetyl-beta-D-mannosaminyltransferase